MTVRQILEKMKHNIQHPVYMGGVEASIGYALSDLKVKFEEMMTLHNHNYTDASESGCEECVKNQAIQDCADECK